MRFARIRLFAAAHKLALAAVSYFAISALLSLTIFLRLLVLPVEPIKYANAILYYLNYYVVGLLGSLLFILILLSQRSFVRQQSRITKIIFQGAIIVFFAALEVILLLLGIQDYIALIVLIPVAAGLYVFQRNPKKNISRKRITSFLTLLIAAGCLLPPLTAYLCFDNVISQVSARTPSEKASFISEFVAHRNFNSPQLLPTIISSLRMNSDFQKYLMTGVGACGEMATSASTFLNMMGLDARRVGLPAEDHAFIEVKLNGTWMVIDPGYYYSEILTKEERANRRINEMGAISYVVAASDSSFVELTQYYVPTDIVEIRVTSDGEPLANVQIFLEHTFRGQSFEVPGGTQQFYTNSNGTVTLHLGGLDYNANAEKVDRFFNIYVNGVKSDYTVRSLGVGDTHSIDIELTQLKDT